jgi:hypothetical protein
MFRSWCVWVVKRHAWWLLSIWTILFSYYRGLGTGSVTRVRVASHMRRGKKAVLEDGARSEFKRAMLDSIVVHRYSCQHKYVPEWYKVPAMVECPQCLNEDHSYGVLVRIENDPGIPVRRARI